MTVLLESNGSVIPDKYTGPLYSARIYTSHLSRYEHPKLKKNFSVSSRAHMPVDNFRCDVIFFLDETSARNFVSKNFPGKICEVVLTSVEKYTWVYVNVADGNRAPFYGPAYVSLECLKDITVPAYVYARMSAEKVYTPVDDGVLVNDKIKKLYVKKSDTASKAESAIEYLNELQEKAISTLEQKYNISRNAKNKLSIPLINKHNFYQKHGSTSTKDLNFTLRLDDISSLPSGQNVDISVQANLRDVFMSPDLITKQFSPEEIRDYYFIFYIFYVSENHWLGRCLNKIDALHDPRLYKYHLSDKNPCIKGAENVWDIQPYCSDSFSSNTLSFKLTLNLKGKDGSSLPRNISALENLFNNITNLVDLFQDFLDETGDQILSACKEIEDHLSKAPVVLDFED